MANGWTNPAGSFIRRLMNRTSDTGAAAGATTSSPSLATLGGWRALLANPGLVLNTIRHGLTVGQDGQGNQYFEERKSTLSDGRKRRWVVYADQAREASLVPPEWHAWLHFTTDQPLSEALRRPWQKPHQPNLTGTPFAYRPRGHDYNGGNRTQVSADYEPWTPDA